VNKKVNIKNALITNSIVKQSAICSAPLGVK